MIEYSTVWKCTRCGTVHVVAGQVYSEFETRTLPCKGCKRQRKHTWAKTQGVKHNG